MLEQLQLGPLQANCYLYGDDKTALVIDPGGEPECVLARAGELSVSISALVCTHGHFDHIGGLTGLAEVTGAVVLIHAADLGLALNGGLAPAGDDSADLPPGIPAWLAEPLRLPSPPRTVSDGEVIAAGSASLTVLHTPGHTPGGICLYDEAAGVLFSGDTLFRLGVGRADLPGGHGRALLNSIKQRLFVLPDTTRVYPGHGPSTLIGLEKHRNPFVRAETG